MPIDASIWSRQQPSRARDQLGTLGNIYESIARMQEHYGRMQEQRLRIEALRKENEDNQAADDAQRMFGLDTDKAIKWLIDNGHGNAAILLRTKAAQAKEHVFNALKAQNEQYIKNLEWSIGLLRGVKNDADYQQVYPIFHKVNPEVAEIMGAHWPGQAEMDVWFGSAGVLDDVLKLRKDILEAGKADDETFIRYVSTAQSQDELDELVDAAKALNVSPQLRAKIPQKWSPEAMRNFRRAGMTPAEQAADDAREQAAEEQRKQNLHTRNYQDTQLKFSEQTAAIARAREQRLGGAAAGGTGPDAIMKRQMAEWRINALKDINEKRIAEERMMGTGYTADQARDMTNLVERLYAQAMGLPPPVPIPKPAEPPPAEKPPGAPGGPPIEPAWPGTRPPVSFSPGFQGTEPPASGFFGGQDAAPGVIPKGLPQPVNMTPRPPSTPTIPGPTTPPFARPAPTLPKGLEVDKPVQLDDGRTIIVREVDEKTGQITDYDLVSPEIPQTGRILSVPGAPPIGR